MSRLNAVRPEAFPGHSTDQARHHTEEETSEHGEARRDRANDPCSMIRKFPIRHNTMYKPKTERRGNSRDQCPLLRHANAGDIASWIFETKLTGI